MRKTSISRPITSIEGPTTYILSFVYKLFFNIEIYKF